MKKVTAHLKFINSFDNTNNFLHQIQASFIKKSVNKYHHV